ncbi:hypothetical protein [Sinomonas sp. G460-2]|uniref:hypothetical protein n=1 Tax=Sinomonas sp. G460-2 TaxID=3393464 RepID=UPI0039EFE0CE
MSGRLVRGIAFASAAIFVAVAATADATLPGIVLDPAQRLASLRPIDGGAGYFSRFAHSLPTDSSYFPVALWFESLVDDEGVSADRSAGINTYLELTDDSQPERAARAGSFAIPSTPASPAAGYLLGDEIDMWAGPGTGTWTGNFPGDGDICAPADATCGFSVLAARRKLFPQGAASFANFGKGVLFWESDADAARFVASADVVSADAYWFTDPDICVASQGGSLVGGDRALSDPGECRRAANYGWVVDRMRSLVQPQGSKPVWAFIELGHPFDDGSTISPDQVRAAVWESLIHGARGIVYFNHSFGGACPTQHLLRDPCSAAMRAAVTALNHQIADLAPVLNAPFVDHGASADGKVDVAVKDYQGKLYLFAAATGPGAQDVTFTAPCWSGGAVTVLGEGRTLEGAGHTFTDHFASATAVHLYRLDAPNVCRL